MAPQLFSATTIATTLLLSILIILIMRHILPRQTTKSAGDLDLTTSPMEPASQLTKNLLTALSESVIFPDNSPAFEQWRKNYWAKQESEVTPACVVQPRDLHELCTAITLLKREYDAQTSETSEGEKNGKARGLFAIRSGGHSSVSGAASIRSGVVIDMSLFCEVTPSQDGDRVVIGVGARWMHVSKVLDDKGLAVIGGRNSNVGVGGLTLGGGLSFYSPQFGLSCSNILSYEVVLASGSAITASISTNSDLWRALKGGSNNFGIVTRITARSFPSTKVWSGFLYMPAFQSAKVLAAFHDFVNRGDPRNPSNAFDRYAAGPLACFTYLQALGIQVISVNVVYTKPPEEGENWPKCWSTSSFKSLWRLWSTCKVRTLTSATDELNSMDPTGKRQTGATVTIKNDTATITAVHNVYRNAITSIRQIKGIIWTLVLQPILPDWVCKGDPNPLGLHDCREPLIIVSFSVNWLERKDDELVRETTHSAIEKIERFAEANNTGHPYRYLNYCGAWQRPFEGYGEENLRFLQGVSRKYDPEGLFQKACIGGFKLNMRDVEA